MTPLDWTVVAGVVALALTAGLALVRLSSRHGAVSYFTGDRNLPWWAIAISNTATYQSGNGAFVMLILTYGLAANWLWWSSWILWMPLVAVVWAPLWRRMRIITTAELITLRYGGRPALVARKVYAVVCCFGFSVLLIGYITGFFAKTIAPLVNMSELEILLLFGGTTVLYTMFGGLVGVVATEVLHFAILLIGCSAFMFIAVSQHGGWSHLLERIAATRPEALAQTPPALAATPENSIGMLTIIILALQGIFFAGSPTAGEGSTAQRFMAARNERHAIAGQLFNCFLALCLRILPLIGTGLVALALFWPASLARTVTPPAGIIVLDDPVTAWAEVIKSCRLPNGLVGLLVAVEVAAYTSTLSALINWGSSFVINDLYRPLDPHATVRREIWVSRLTTLVLFVAASAVAILFVKQMVGWFLFINSAMVIFLLPLAFFRFFWWRFNVWGELSAIVFGLPLSILVWFVFDFQNPAKHPIWEGLGLLFGLSFLVLTVATLVTPAESEETLTRFFRRCRPPGFWGPIRCRAGLTEPPGPSGGRLLINSALGVFACLGLVLATNALFVGDWLRLTVALTVAFGLGGWLVRRIVETPTHDDTPRDSNFDPEVAEGVAAPEADGLPGAANPDIERI
jgi:solute:Na+ symporter, SSS family